jgi:hypothetical protein
MSTPLIHQYESAAKAEDLLDLANHIGWTDVLLPELKKAKDNYSALLVQKVLGNHAASPFSTEQLAGRVAGIDFMLGLFNSIITKGERASKFLQEYHSTIYNSIPPTN